MSKMKSEEIKDAVRRGYAEAVTNAGGCCGSEPRGEHHARVEPAEAAAPDSCCGGGGTSVTADPRRQDLATRLGYDQADLSRLPDGAVASAFGCGNPVAFAGVQRGEVVLDIGSGAGIDCLLAAEKVGPEGRVIGLDMTPEMIAKARENVTEAGVDNVEFRLGDAEAMPIAEDTADWAISNCVINLAPDKPKVFLELFRVLKRGGKVSISDIVLSENLPADVVEDVSALVGCIAGAVTENEYLGAMRDAGLVDVAVTDRQPVNASGCCGNDSRLEGKVWSVRVTGRKP